MIALLLGVAFAGEPEVWAALHDGRAVQSLDRDPAAAVAIYQTVLDHLPEDDPIRGELLFWLGRAAFEAGEVDRAIEALRDAAADPSQHDAARTLGGRIQEEHNAVVALPHHDDFREGTGPWVRGWPRGMDADLGASAIELGDDPALSWSTDVREGEEDWILLPLGPGRHLTTRVRFVVRSAPFPTHLRLLLRDASGKEWTAPLIEVPTDRWLPVDVALAAFAPSDAPAARQRPDPASIRAIVLKDVSAFHDVHRGAATIWIDDVTVSGHDN